jgi:hypothetical protein
MFEVVGTAVHDLVEPASTDPRSCCVVLCVGDESLQRPDRALADEGMNVVLRRSHLRFGWGRKPRKSNPSSRYTIWVFTADNGKPIGASTWAISSRTTPCIAASSAWLPLASALGLTLGGLSRPLFCFRASWRRASEAEREPSETGARRDPVRALETGGSELPQRHGIIHTWAGLDRQARRECEVSTSTSYLPGSAWTLNTPVRLGQ